MTSDQISLQMILNAGDARSLSMEAIQDAKKYDFKSAEEKLTKADSGILKAHNQQTELIQKEAQGENNEVSILLIHAQDHLMTAMAVRDMAQELVDIYRKFSEVRG